MTGGHSCRIIDKRGDDEGAFEEPYAGVHVVRPIVLYRSNATSSCPLGSADEIEIKKGNVHLPILEKKEGGNRNTRVMSPGPRCDVVTVMRRKAGGGRTCVMRKVRKGMKKKILCAGRRTKKKVKKWTYNQHNVRQKKEKIRVRASQGEVRVEIVA